MQIQSTRMRVPVAMALGVWALFGCSGGEDATATAKSIKVNTPAELAQRSADDYNLNENGLITGSTLQRWISDWINNRPAGVTGKLVILQMAAGKAGYEFIKPDGRTVFTYQEAGWAQTRKNGVIETMSMVLDGASMDALLNKYNIDPANDMIVCAQGTGSPVNAMAQGRCWYHMRYWGVDKTHLAILNGGNEYLGKSGGMAASDFTAKSSTTPATPTSYSVKNLKVDNIALQATVQDLMRVLPDADRNVTSDGVFIWDAREVGQYSAGEWLEGAADCGAGKSYCAAPPGYDYMKKFQNNASRQGHPRGTLQLNYIHMLDASKEYSYKPKAELLNYLNGGLDASGYGFVAADYQPVGVGNAYQPGDTVYAFCETTYRAMITGMVSAVILGLPTRFYDGAMVEWNSLSSLPDRTGNAILPSDSPWRTDVKSFFRPAINQGLVDPRNIVDPYASSSNAIVNADRLYKTGETIGGGGAAVLPANPCGG